MGTSPLQSLQKSTPNSYIICPHLNFQRKLQIHLRFRGLCAKLHHNHFDKGSHEQIIITMQFLAQNYPKSIYGMGSFEFGPNLRKTGIYKGLIAKLAKLHLIEGIIAKMHVTTVISSSNYPKNHIWEAPV